MGIGPVLATMAFLTDPVLAQEDRAATAASAFQAGPARVALLVGASTFDGVYEPLAFTAHDVVDMALVLLDPGVGRFGEIRVLVEPEALGAALDEAGAEGADPALLARIRAARVGAPIRTTLLAELAALDTRPWPAGSLALVYLSSHGDLIGDEQFFVAGDTRKADLAATGLKLEDLRAAFKAIDADQRMLVKAFCHSGDFRTAKGQRPWLVGQVESEVSATTRLGEADEDARLKNDLYTYYFVQSLSEGRTVADINRDGAVSDLEAHGYAVQALVRGGASQRPTLTRHQVLDTPIVLAGEAGVPELATLLSGRGDLLDYSFSFALKKKGGGGDPTSVTDQAQVVMAPGCYRLTIRDPRTDALRYRGPACMTTDENLVMERLIDRQEQVELRLGLGGTPLSGAELQDNLLGRGPQVQVAAGFPLRGARRVRWIGDVALAGGFGFGRQEVFGAAYDTRSPSVTATLALRWLQRLPMGDVSLGPLAGYSLGHRSAALAPGEEGVPISSFGWLAPLTGLRAMVELTPGTRWTTGVSADLWVYGLAIDGDTRPRATLNASLLAGRRF